MSAPDLIFELREAGYSIKADGRYLDIYPADDLPAEIVERLKQSKAEILDVLHHEQQQDFANLSRLVARVCYADGWQDSDIWQAIRLALDDYDDALVTFTEQAAMMGMRLDDDRRGCFECGELMNGFCQAAKRGLIPGADRRGYEPVRYMMRRCDQFKTKG